MLCMIALWVHNGKWQYNCLNFSLICCFFPLHSLLCVPFVVLVQTSRTISGVDKV